MHFIHFTSADNWKKAAALLGEEHGWCPWILGNPEDYISVSDVGRAMVGRRMVYLYAGGYREGRSYPNLFKNLRTVGVGDPDDNGLIHKDDVRIFVARLVSELLDQSDEDGPPVIFRIPSD